MINVIFKMKNHFNHYPNELIPVNNQYFFNENNYSAGSFSRTNIFIGENNSGKSRFLRYLFQNDFLTIDDENIEKFYSTVRQYLNYTKKIH